MKKLILLLLIGFSNYIFSQTITEIDSVSYEFCDYLKHAKIENDTIQLRNLYEEKFYPYLNERSEEDVDRVAQQLYYRLQRNCITFRNLLDRIYPPKEAAIRVTEKPKSEISRKQLKAFKNEMNLYYFETAGDTTKVSMNNGIWMDFFSDNTYSKLSYNWIDTTEFELVFIESNNESRSNFSVKGDKLFYQVLAKGDDFYLMSVNIPGQTTYEKFKIYYKTQP